MNKPKIVASSVSARVAVDDFSTGSTVEVARNHAYSEVAALAATPGPAS